MESEQLLLKACATAKREAEPLLTLKIRYGRVRFRSSQ